MDLLLGPYGTNMVAAAMPVVMNNNRTIVSILAIGINRHFQYPRYFVSAPFGPDGVKAMTRGFFELAAAQKPRPQSVAIVAADAEFAKSSADGARANAEELGFKIVADRSYPPGTTDMLPMMRSVRGANPDLVFVAAYPPDTVGIVRAANEVRVFQRSVRLCRRADRGQGGGGDEEPRPQHAGAIHPHAHVHDGCRRHRLRQGRGMG